MHPPTQAGAVPFRRIDSRLEFLLVTSRQGNWIFPKGQVDPGETPETTALKEVEEEAGVCGTVLPGPLGSYTNRKSWNPRRVLMFLFEYSKDCDRWRESGTRAIRWCSYDDARRLLKKEKLKDLLAAARSRLQKVER